MFLACGKTDRGGMTGDLPLDVVERADTVERFAGDRGFGLVPFVMEVAPQVGPTRCLLQAVRPRDAIGR